MITIRTRFSNNKYLPFTRNSSIQTADTVTIMRELEKLYKNPLEVQYMLIEDFESDLSSGVLPLDEEDDADECSYELTSKVTTMSIEDILKYVGDSPMFLTMISELETRGVDVAMFLANIRREATRWTEAKKEIV